MDDEREQAVNHLLVPHSHDEQQILVQDVDMVDELGGVQSDGVGGLDHQENEIGIADIGVEEHLQVRNQQVHASQ